MPILVGYNIEQNWDEVPAFMNLYFRNLGQVINKFVSDKEKCMKEMKDG